MRLTLRFLAVLVLALGVAPEAAARPPVVVFAIHGLSLEDALFAFATQANISLSLPTSPLLIGRGRDLTGKYTIEAGLTRLLYGTSYQFERVGDKAFRVYRKFPNPVGVAPQQRSERPDTITVTGARLLEPLSDLPQSVAIVDTQRLTQLQFHDAADLSQAVSGLAFTNLGPGRNKIQLRGISDGALTGRAESTVGIYLDDIRLTYSSPDPDLQLVDIGKAEVLRGPHGTLYGAGSIGGVLHVVTNPVDLSRFASFTNASTEGSEDGGSGFNLEAGVNIPLFPGRLGMRGVYYDQYVGGWLDNPGLSLKNTNSTQRRGGRLTVLGQLTQDLSVRAFGLAQAIRSADSQYLGQSPRGSSRSTRLLEPHDNDVVAFGFAAHYANSWWAIDSTTTVIQHEGDSRYDATGSFVSLGIDTTRPRPIDERMTNKFLLHETRARSLADAEVPWVVGVFYADGAVDRTVKLRDGELGVWRDVAYLELRADRVDEAAVFGEIAWPITSHISLTTGLRWYGFNLQTTAKTSQLVGGQSDAFTGHVGTTDFAPELRLAYHPFHGILLYASASEGHRSPGFNTGGPVGAAYQANVQPFRMYRGDELWTYEFGARVAALDDRFNVDIALFANDWRRIQTDELKSNGFIYTGNAGDGQAYGLEFDSTYKPRKELTLRANAIFNQHEVLGQNPTFPSATDVQFPGAATFSGGGSVRYEHIFEWGRMGVHGYAEVFGRYIGKSFLGFARTTAVGDYGQFDARIGGVVDTWDVSAYVQNLTGSKGATISDGNPYLPGAPSLITPLRARTFGVSVRKVF